LKAKWITSLAKTKRFFFLNVMLLEQALTRIFDLKVKIVVKNIRRISEVAKLFALSGQVCFVAFISPYSKDRDYAKEIHQAAGLPFYECHIAATLEVCEKRDVKGLYKKAREGIIKNFTGISDPYEAPENPALSIDTGSLSIDACVKLVTD